MLPVDEPCTKLAMMDRVVFLFTPSHKGIAPNAYADAAAKSHLTAPRGQDDSLAMHVVSKPSLYRVRSDFDAQGRLHTLSTAATSPWILWDRSLFKATRKRSLRWVHTQMMEGAKHVLLDTTFIGRRGGALVLDQCRHTWKPRGRHGLGGVTLNGGV